MNESSDLEGCPLLAGTPREDLRRDCPTARIVTIRPRGTIYRQGEPGQTVFCVLDGQVTLARVSYDGATLTTAALEAGDFFGPALSGATVPKIPQGRREPFRYGERRSMNFGACTPPPGSRLGICFDSCASQHRLERRLESFAFKRAEARLAETFRELSGGFATRCEHGFGQHLRLTQQELADLVGASRPVVSTILNKLRDKGVLGYNREYVCVRGIEEIAKLIDS